MSQNPSPSFALLRSAWETMARGDSSALEHLLAPDATWLSVEGLGGICRGRDEILAFLRRGIGPRPRGEVVETIDMGTRMVIGFRPATVPDGRPLDGGLAHVVITVRYGQIVEIKGCRGRADALAYAEAARFGE